MPGRAGTPWTPSCGLSRWSRLGAGPPQGHGSRTSPSGVLMGVLARESSSLAVIAIPATLAIPSIVAPYTNSYYSKLGFQLIPRIPLVLGFY